jgi:hypothetical protein
MGACAPRWPEGAVVESADVRLTLLTDGSVQVRETVAIHFGDRPAESFTRSIARAGVDEFIDIAAHLDGRQLVETSGVDRATVSRERGLRVDWRFPPAANRLRTFALTYRAVGVLGLEGNRAELRWDARPLGVGTATGPLRVEFIAPGSARFVTPPAMVGSGWQVAGRADGMVADKSSLASDEHATIAAVLAADSLAATEPTWQYNAGRARELMPAFLASGPFILIVGAGVFGLLRLQFPVKPAEGQEDRAGRLAAANGLRTSGLAMIGLAVVTAGLLWWFLPAYGLSPMAIPVSLALDGVLFLAAAVRFPLAQ